MGSSKRTPTQARLLQTLVDYNPYDAQVGPEVTFHAFIFTISHDAHAGGRYNTGMIQGGRRDETPADL